MLNSKKQIRSRLCPYDLFVFTFFSDLTDKHIKTSFSIDFKIKVWNKIDNARSNLRLVDVKIDLISYLNKCIKKSFDNWIWFSFFY